MVRTESKPKFHRIFQELNFEPDLYIWNIYIWISLAKCCFLLSPPPKLTSFPYMLKELFVFETVISFY